jgi:hypothetical protein
MTKIALYQSFYKEEQKQFLDLHCYPYNNIVNPSPDLREYPQMKDIHKICGNTHDAYGLVSWKFEQKTLIKPSQFLSFVKDTFNMYDFWFINPCYIMDALFISPWEQGEIHHPGMRQLAQDTLDSMGREVPRLDRKLFPSSKTFYANYFMAKPHIWDCIFAFMDKFYDSVDKTRMNKPSGYSGDPNMSHFIFLFERLVPTFLIMNPLIKVGKYNYQHYEVKDKSSYEEFKMVNILADMKDDLYYAKDVYAQPLMNAYVSYRDAFIARFPQAFGKE